MHKAGETIYVVLSVYDPRGTYAQHAGVTLASLFENTQAPVIAYVLHDDTLTLDNRQKFLRTAEQYGQTVELINVGNERSHDMANAAKGTCYTAGMFYRLLTPELLSTDKVIYLDCDVVVCLDIRELWELDLNGNCLAGVLDSWSSGKPALSAEALRIRINGGRRQEYINSGVLLMDLERIRERGNLFRQVMDYLRRYFHTSPCPDQDALNTLFLGEIKIIDRKFNRDVRTMKGGEDPSGSIIHYVGAKPWRGITGLPLEALYWEAWLRSAWGENVTAPELVHILNRAAAGRRQPRPRFKDTRLFDVPRSIWYLMKGAWDWARYRQSS